MGRKILERKLTKSKIEEKQKLVSDSVVVSQAIKENLDKKSEDLKVKITSQEEIYQTIINDVKEINEEKDINDELYKISKDKLIEANKILEDTENKEKQKSKDIELLEKEYKNKNKDLNISFETSKNNFDDILSKTENKLFKMEEKNKEQLSENKSIEKQNNNLIKDIKDNNLILSDLKSKKETLKTDIELLGKKNDVICEEVEIIIQVLKDIEEDKRIKENEINTITENYRKLQKDLEIAKKELIKTREVNVRLVKKEENLNSRALHIKGVYEKAGLDINI